MSTEVMRQVRNALVWNLNTDLDNIPACEQWANMLRKNIDDLDKAIADAELKWVGLTYEEESELIRLAHNHAGIRFYIQAAEAKLKDKNGF
jgi:hypothetical protein